MINFHLRFVFAGAISLNYLLYYLYYIIGWGLYRRLYLAGWEDTKLPDQNGFCYDTLDDVY
jgi:hypothetical protein